MTAPAAPDIVLRRAYEPATADDGYRVLIDGIWPRGVSREDLRIDEWARELAVSTELRRWYGHEPEHFDEFRQRYRQELAQHRDKLEELRDRARRGRLTIVYGARDTEHSNAVVLEGVLREAPVVSAQQQV
jgi:uncharacterized protein YeaO (DUF488 family)